MEIKTLFEKVMIKKNNFVSTPKEHCEVILFDFEKPIKKKKHKDTEYIYYNCQFIKIKNKNKTKEIAPGKHILQLSYKIAWCQLYLFLKKENKLKEKNLHLYINKVTNYHFLYTLNTKHDDRNHESRED